MDAPDTTEATTVHDHPFEPIDDVWWKLCRHCNLGRASHTQPCEPRFDPPFKRPPGDRPTDEGDDHGDDEDLPIVTNEDTMLDAQMHLKTEDHE
jgi:hypothetical protein